MPHSGSTSRRPPTGASATSSGRVSPLASQRAQNQPHRRQPGNRQSPLPTSQTRDARASADSGPYVPSAGTSTTPKRSVAQPTASTPAVVVEQPAAGRAAAKGTRAAATATIASPDFTPVGSPLTPRKGSTATTAVIVKGGASSPIVVEREVVEEPEEYVAKHSFKASQPMQLSVSKGDIVIVTSKLKSGWWQGSLADGTTGWLPGSYLKPADEVLQATLESAQNTRAATSARPKKSSGSISTSSSKTDVSAQQGDVQGSSTHQPLSTPPVSPPQKEPGPASPPPGALRTQDKAAAMGSTSSINSRASVGGAAEGEGELYVIKHAFEARRDKQLTLPRRGFVRVRAKKKSGWWLGDLLANDGKVVLASGWFPAGYVSKSEDPTTRTVALRKQPGQRLGIGLTGGKVPCFDLFEEGWLVLLLCVCVLCVCLCLCVCVCLVSCVCVSCGCGCVSCVLCGRVCVSHTVSLSLSAFALCTCCIRGVFVCVCVQRGVAMF